MSNKKDKKEVYKQWWFWVIVGVVAVIGIGGAVSNNGKKIEPSKPVDTSKKTTEENPNLFEETEMEAFCQEDHVNDINGYFSGHKISIIKITDYNKYFKADEGKTKDEKSDVALLTWKGHDKTDNKDIDFSCWASKTNGEKKLLYLSANGQAIRGSLDF